MRAPRDTHATVTRELVFEYLRDNPGSTQHDLAVALGVQQQRIAEALHALDARIVGYRPNPNPQTGRGGNKSHREYALADHDTRATALKELERKQAMNNLTSVWAHPYKVNGR